MYDAVALGELLIDFSCVSHDPDGFPAMEAHPGGAPANFLAALSCYGCRTALLGKVGDDAFGRLLTAALAERGIETGGIVSDETVFTTLAFVTNREDGDREFSFARKPGADTALRPDELRLDMIDAARVFHFGTLSLTDEPARSATRMAVKYAKSGRKLISFDPNLRKPLWRDLKEAATQIEWGLKQADIVKISDEEVEFLWKSTPEAGAKKLLREYGVKLAFVTCGAEGCVYANRNVYGREEALRGIKAVDSTGAGDIFGGSALSRILKMGKAPEMLNAEELRDITTFATAAAGLSATRSGGISSVPSLEEVLEAIEKK